MRVMKESNYQRFRQILSDPSLFGDEILALMKEHGKTLGISQQAFELVYQGFWDLYCKKPANTTDIPAKKLEGFISRVKLITPPQDVTEEDGSVTRSVANLPLKAMVRIRIPLNRPAPVAEMRDDEDPSDAGDATNRSPPDETQRSGMPSSREHQQLSTHPDEDTSTFTEQAIEDRVLLINPISE